MSNKILVETKIPNPNGTYTVKKFEVEFNYKESKVIGFEYVPPADGGPLMRPTRPPR